MNKFKKWKTDDIDDFTSVSKIQVHLQTENAEYLCKHPEIRAIVRVLVHEAINKQAANPALLAASIFDCNLNVVLKPKIDEEVKFLYREMKKSNWDKYDSENMLPKTSSTQSLLSTSSLISDMESILRFCFILPK